MIYILYILLYAKRNHSIKGDRSVDELMVNYLVSCDNGILKVMSKMGISTLQSYKGAQIFEALGVDNSVVDKCFTGTQTRIKGVTFDIIAADALAFHERGYPSRETIGIVALPE